MCKRLFLELKADNLLKISVNNYFALTELQKKLQFQIFKSSYSMLLFTPLLSVTDIDK